MFGIGPLELVAILVVALLIFGPAKLPELARTLGRGLAEFRRASSDLRQTLTAATEEPPKPAPPPQGPADQMASGETPAAKPETPPATPPSDASPKADAQPAESGSKPETATAAESGSEPEAPSAPEPADDATKSA